MAGLSLTLSGIISQNAYIVWTAGNDPIFAEIYSAPDDLRTSVAIKDARLYFATLFLEEELCRLFSRMNIVVPATATRSLVAGYTESRLDTDILPEGLVLDIDQVLPETTRRQDWGERRRSILTLSPLEKMRLQNGRK